MKNYNDVIKVSEHNHFGGSLFDAVDEVENYIKAAKNAGYAKVASSDHGSFSSMQTCIDLASKYGLEIIYSVEAYIEVPPFSIEEKVGHLILAAMDEEGKHIIDKLNSSGIDRKGIPVITWEALSKANLKGHVLATSACISGAPALQILANDIIHNMVSRIEKRRDSKTDKDGNLVCLNPSNPEYVNISDKKMSLEDELVFMKKTIKDNPWKSERQALTRAQKDAEKKYKMATNDADRELYRAQADSLNFQINAVKTKEEKYKELYNTKKNEYTICKNAFNELDDKVSKWLAYDSEIKELESKLVNEDELISNAEQQLLKYANLFGKDNYYVEVQNHGLKDEARVYPVLAQLARKNGIKIIAANDSHMADNSERSIHMRQVAKFLRFRTISWDDSDLELYIKTPNQLAEWLLKILPEDIVDEAMLNLNEFGDKCNYAPIKTAHYPVFDKTKDSNALLREEAYKGIEWRYPNGIGWDEEHQKRLEYELNVIIQMGFADYHLIVKDFLEYGRIIGRIPIEYLDQCPLTIEGAKAFVEENGWDVGLGIGIGRGSGAGSLVTYLLGITGVDPFKYGLIFERFLNPERISMPDIDSDFAIGVREKTIEYVRNKYGSNAVVGIITESREGVKGAIRDAASYYGKLTFDDDKKFLSLGDSMRKKVPDAVNITFNSVVEEGVTVLSMLRDTFADNKDALAIIEIAKDLENMLTTYGQHAAGVIIYDGEDITDYIPTRLSKSGGRVTEMNMIQAEANKLLKMDFLGLKNLNIITDTLRMIETTTGKAIDITQVPLEGPEADRVYDLYRSGKTKNIFQFESPGMRKYLKQMLN